MDQEGLIKNHLTDDKGNSLESTKKKNYDSITCKNLGFEMFDKKENQFSAQYSQTYTHRLRELANATKSRAMKIWPDLTPLYVSEQKSEEQVIVVGTIWKDVKKKVSYLKVLESPSINDLYIINDNKFAGDNDEIFIGNICLLQQCLFNTCKGLENSSLAQFTIGLNTNLVFQTNFYRG